MAQVLRGGKVCGLDVVDANAARPRWLQGIGGEYIDGRKVPADRVEKAVGSMDLIFETTGIASLEFNLLDALAVNGVYVITGIPGGDRPLQIAGAELVRQLMLCSVNAARGHFQMGVDDLAHAHLSWGAHLEQLITHHHAPDKLSEVVGDPQSDAIKEVIEWAATARRQQPAH